MNKGSNDEADQDKTACHELGHTVGLRHNHYDCMVTGERPNLNEQWEHYGSHHRYHINSWF